MWRTIPRSLLRPAPDTPGTADAEIAGLLAARLDSAAQRRLGRSLAVLHAKAGGCSGCAQETTALRGTAYDLERYGLSFVTSPRHADVLLVTGPLTHAMRGAIESVWTAMPEPRWLVAVGACAIDGGIFAGSYAVAGGIGVALPVDITVAGCPPSPTAMLTALLTLIEANC
jgi:Ni,Fe-hydrogenase III small subunit